MAVAPSELFPAPSYEADSLHGNVVVGELLNRSTGEWEPQLLTTVRADWVEQTISGLHPVYDNKNDRARHTGYERDIRPGVVAVTVTDEIIACNALVVVAKNGRRTMLSAMMHGQSKKPGLVANTFRAQPELRLVK